MNPLRPWTLEGIRYRRDGRICSGDAEIDRDLESTLNLNQALLVRNRRAALGALNGKLQGIGERRGPGAVRAFCGKYVQEHLSDASVREPFDGMLIYFMRRRLRAKA